MLDDWEEESCGPSSSAAAPLHPQQQQGSGGSPLQDKAGGTRMPRTAPTSAPLLQHGNRSEDRGSNGGSSGGGGGDRSGGSGGGNSVADSSGSRSHAVRGSIYNNLNTVYNDDGGDIGDDGDEGDGDDDNGDGEDDEEAAAETADGGRGGGGAAGGPLQLQVVSCDVLKAGAAGEHARIACTSAGGGTLVLGTADGWLVRYDFDSDTITEIPLDASWPRESRAAVEHVFTDPTGSHTLATVTAAATTTTTTSSSSSTSASAASPRHRDDSTVAALFYVHRSWTSAKLLLLPPPPAQAALSLQQQQQQGRGRLSAGSVVAAAAVALSSTVVTSVAWNPLGAESSSGSTREVVVGTRDGQLLLLHIVPSQLHDSHITAATTTAMSSSSSSKKTGKERALRPLFCLADADREPFHDVKMEVVVVSASSTGAASPMVVGVQPQQSYCYLVLAATASRLYVFTGASSVEATFAPYMWVSVGAAEVFPKFIELPADAQASSPQDSQPRSELHLFGSSSGGSHHHHHHQHAPAEKFAWLAGPGILHGTLDIAFLARAASARASSSSASVFVSSPGLDDDDASFDRAFMGGSVHDTPAHAQGQALQVITRKSLIPYSSLSAGSRTAAGKSTQSRRQGQGPSGSGAVAVAGGAAATSGSGGAVRPLSMAVTDFHFLLLYPDSIQVVNQVSEKVVQTLPLATLLAYANTSAPLLPSPQHTFTVAASGGAGGRGGGAAGYMGMIGFAADTSAPALYAYCGRHVYEVSVDAALEARHMWRVWLAKGEYAMALATCSSAHERDHVLLAQAVAAFSTKDYMRAAAFYSKVSSAAISFEEVSLKFVSVGAQDALLSYLLYKLDHLPREERAQVTMVATWATELYLDKINRCSSNTSNTALAFLQPQSGNDGGHGQPQRQADATGVMESEEGTGAEGEASVVRELRAFLSDWKDVLDQVTTIKLLSSYGREEEVVFFASLKGLHAIVIQHHIRRGEVAAAIEVLKRPNTPLDLLYKFSPALVAMDPRATVDLWIHLCMRTPTSSSSSSTSVARGRTSAMDEPSHAASATSTPMHHHHRLTPRRLLPALSAVEARSRSSTPAASAQLLQVPASAHGAGAHGAGTGASAAAWGAGQAEGEVREEGIRFLEFCVDRMGSRDAAVHNLLVSLYADRAAAARRKCTAAGASATSRRRRKSTSEQQQQQQQQRLQEAKAHAAADSGLRANTHDAARGTMVPVSDAMDHHNAQAGEPGQADTGGEAHVGADGDGEKEADNDRRAAEQAEQVLVDFLSRNFAPAALQQARLQQQQQAGAGPLLGLQGASVVAADGLSSGAGAGAGVGDVFVFDAQYALRVCMERRCMRACVAIYSRLHMHLEAVALALQMDEGLAKAEAGKAPQHDHELRRTLWLSIARHVIAAAASEARASVATALPASSALAGQGDDRSSREGGVGSNGDVRSKRSEKDPTSPLVMRSRGSEEHTGGGAGSDDGEAQEGRVEREAEAEDEPDAEAVVLRATVRRAVSFLREAGGLLRIEDVLPFFPNFSVVIDHEFKEAVCESLEQHNATIEGLKADMRAAAAAAEAIRGDIAALSQRYAIVQPDEPCGICGKRVLTTAATAAARLRQAVAPNPATVTAAATTVPGGAARAGPADRAQQGSAVAQQQQQQQQLAPLYVFPCAHAFHAQCLAQHRMAYASQDEMERIAQLRAALARLLQGGDFASDAVSSSGGSGSGSIGMDGWSSDVLSPPIDRVRAALDDAIAAECPFCGSLAVRSVAEPFVGPRAAMAAETGEQDESESWRV